MSLHNKGGRPRKPTTLHKLEGTFNATRHGRDRAREPQPFGDLRTPPPGMTPAQRKEWRYQIANYPAGVLKKCDRHWLRAWCIAVGHLDNEDVQQDIKALGQVLQIMGRVSTELGFSPAARPRIQAAPPAASEVEEDPWAQLKVVQGGRA